MALETEDDYQDEIDDLMKEIDRLYDEGTDKGFKLKREEDMDQEERATNDKELQKKLGDRGKKIDQLKELDEEYSELKIQLKKLEDDEDLIKSVDGMNSNKKRIDKIKAEMKILEKEKKTLSSQIDKLTDKIEELQRGEDMDFETRKNSIIADLTGLEARKQEVLDRLELRALETEKDYQREYDRLYAEAESIGKKLEAEGEKKVKEYNDLYDEMQSTISKYQMAKKELKQIEDKLEASDQKYIKMIDKLVAEAKKKGFKIKESHISRSLTTDFELRALETEKEYQNNIDVAKKNLKSGEENIKNMTKKIKELEDSIKATEDLMELYKDRIDRVYKEGTKKGFKLKRSEETGFEVRALETFEDYQDKMDLMVKEANRLAATYEDEWAKYKIKALNSYKEQEKITGQKISGKESLAEKYADNQSSVKSLINKLDSQYKKMNDLGSDCYKKFKKRPKTSGWNIIDI